jgi:hypothetical protein
MREEMFRKILSNFFWNFLDHAGTLILINLAWFLWTTVNFFVFSTILKPAAPVLILTVTVPLGGIYFVCNRIMENKEVRFADFLAGLRRVALRTALLVIIDVAALVLIAFNLSFYARFSEDHPHVGIALWACVVSVFFILLLANQFAFAALVRGERNPIRALVSSAKIALAFLPVSIMLFIQTLCIVILSAVSLVGVAVLVATAVALLQTEALRNLLMKAQGKWEEVPWAREERTIRGLFNPKK